MMIVFVAWVKFIWLFESFVLYSLLRTPTFVLFLSMHHASYIMADSVMSQHNRSI